MANSKVVYCGTTLIDLTADTVTADKLAVGYTAHNAAGVLISGAAVEPSVTGECLSLGGTVDGESLEV